MISSNRRLLALIMAMVFVISSSVMVSAFFDNNPAGTYTELIYVEDAIHHEDIFDISPRFGTSGRLLTRSYTTRTDGLFGVLGTMTTQAWWEMDTNARMIGFGPAHMSITRGPQHSTFLEPRIEISAMHMPIPSNAYIYILGTFFSFAEMHFAGHQYNMWTTGGYTFARH